MFDAKAMGEQLVTVVRDYCARVVAPLIERLAGVEKKLAELPAPKVEDPVELERRIQAEVARAVGALPPPKDGESVDLVALSGEIAAAAAKAVAALPPAQPGRDADPAQIAAAVKQAVDAFPKPNDGAPGPTADEVARLVEAEVVRAVAALPAPPKGDPGKDADLEHVLAFAEKAVADAFAAWPKPPAGQPGKDADAAAITADVLDRVSKAMPVPKDGKSVTVEEVRPLLEGEVARWALEFERRAADVLQRAIAGIAKPKDGLDGLGFDDMSFEHDGGRKAVLRFVRGDKVKEFALTLPALIDCGVYKAGAAYEKGDGVTYGGSFWIAQRDTATAPGANDDWRLSVKRGRDAKGI